MPAYLYQHPETEEVKEIIQGMNEDHEFIDEDGIKWNRLWSSPQLNTEAGIDPWSKNDFLDKTKDTKGNMGDLWDRSKEMSESRAKENDGVDPVKEKYFKKYSKERMGARHPDQKKVYENHQMKVEY
jgi:hypothetical protein